MRDFQLIWLFFCKNELFFIAEKGLYNKKCGCADSSTSAVDTVSFLICSQDILRKYGQPLPPFSRKDVSYSTRPYVVQV